MAPAVSFPDAAASLEKLGHTIRVQASVAILRHLRSVTGSDQADVGDMLSNIQVQPKRKKGAAAAEGEDVEIESTMIYEEQPVPARGGGDFYFDEGGNYADYEAVDNVPAVAPATAPAPAPARAPAPAPAQVTEEVRLRIEANKRAAEARRAAKAADARVETHVESAQLQQRPH